MSSKENYEIVAIDGWGVAPGAPEVVRFLEGPQRRVTELAEGLPSAGSFPLDGRRRFG